MNMNYTFKASEVECNGVGGLATEYQNEYKRLSKIEKLEKKIVKLQDKIKNLTLI